jgi:group I intron endonuclease
MTCAVYWIHHPSHADIFSQGYVGVSVNFDRRLRSHKRSAQNAHLRNAVQKYGWENLVKKTVLIADTDYCLDIETKLRSEDNIGWNIIKGGGIPPKPKKGHSKGKTAWNKGLAWSDEFKEKVSAGVTKLWKNPEYREHMSKAHRGQVSGMKGKQHTPEALAKMSDSHKGSIGRLGCKNSPEVIEKMKQLAIAEKWTCVHCSKTGLSKGAGNRWHFDNCRFKEL